MSTKSLRNWGVGWTLMGAGAFIHSKQAGTLHDNRYEWVGGFHGDELKELLTRCFNFFSNIRGKVMSSRLHVRVGRGA